MDISDVNEVAWENESEEEPLSQIATKPPSEANAESGAAEEIEDIEAPPKKRKKRKKQRFLLTPVRIRKPGPKPKPTPIEEEEPEEIKEEVKEEVVDETELVYTRPSLPRLQQYSPLQLLLDHLLRTIEQKDPEEYFVYPVTEEMAPDYKDLISTPMELITIRNKVERDEYSDLQTFKDDAELICSNAIAYNDSNTIYHQAARKLQAVVEHYVSEHYILSVSEHLPFLTNVSVEALGFDPYPPSQNQKTVPIMGEYKCILDETRLNRDISTSKAAAEKTAVKLTSRKAKTHLAFMRRNSDGLSTLNVLTPEVVGKNDVVKMGDLVGKLKQGTGGLPVFNEHATNMHTPVEYLDYGAYASFAPQYDSTWATLSKVDSDLLMRTYGDRDSAAYAHSMRSFVKDNGYLCRMVDGLLDTLTDGEHSKTTKQLDEDSGLDDFDAVSIDWDSLKSLSNLGLDMSYLDDLQRNSCVPHTVSQKLSRSAQVLRDLETLQRERLNRPPKFTLSKTNGATGVEVQTAANAVGKLSGLIGQLDNGPIVDEDCVKASMGIMDPRADNIDMDLFNEFFQAQ